MGTEHELGQETAMNDFKVTGCYFSHHPGLAEMSFCGRPGKPAWWVTVLHNGRKVNLYHISRMGIQFWYPGGYAGYPNKGDQVADWGELYEDMTYRIDMVVADFKHSINANTFSLDDVNLVPHDWLAGLWFLGNDMVKVLASRRFFQDAGQLQRARQRYEEKCGELLRIHETSDPYDFASILN
jgi:hypothetical protein